MNDPKYNLNAAQVDFLYNYLSITLNFLPTVEEFSNLVRVISESNCSGADSSPATLADFFSKFGGSGDQDQAAQQLPSSCDPFYKFLQAMFLNQIVCLLRTDLPVCILDGLFV